MSFRLTQSKREEEESLLLFRHDCQDDFACIEIKHINGRQTIEPGKHRLADSDGVVKCAVDGATNTALKGYAANGESLFAVISD